LRESKPSIHSFVNADLRNNQNEAKVVLNLEEVKQKQFRDRESYVNYETTVRSEKPHILSKDVKKRIPLRPITPIKNQERKPEVIVIHDETPKYEIPKIEMRHVQQQVSNSLKYLSDPIKEDVSMQVSLEDKISVPVEI
jgi:hypothetical protein